MQAQQSHVPALVEYLYAAAAAANLCYDSCLAEDENMAECIRRCRDCADLCLLTASFVARNSDMSELVKKLCHTACLRCVQECSKHSDAHCRQCAEYASRCAEACA